MLKNILFRILVASPLTLIGSADAVGLMGTSQSFFTSAYCKSYNCKMLSSEDGTWRYSNKYGDSIVIKRQSSNPGSKITASIAFIHNASPEYFGDDQKMINSLQTTLYGKVIGSFPINCYYADKAPYVFAEFQHMGVTKRFVCVTMNNGAERILLVALGGDTAVR